MNTFLRRMREPSTWAGLAVVATIAGVPEVQSDAVMQVLAALASAAAVFMPEKGGR